MHNGANSTGTELAVRDLNAWYGESHILHGMQFDVKRAKSSPCWVATAPARQPR